MINILIGIRLIIFCAKCKQRRLKLKKIWSYSKTDSIDNVNIMPYLVHFYIIKWWDKILRYT